MQYTVVYKALRTRVFLFDDKKYPDPVSYRPGKGLESVASINKAENGRKLEF
ncbi:hypothetical protein OR1_03407 [Geobacter sp. OR-1]|nr:hypothetical protein OR1_03407 [Geobacter sp. OR-1]